MPQLQKNVPLTESDATTPSTVLELSSHQELRQMRGENEVLEGQVEKGVQDLKDAVDELEAFAYSVSHDLRAPLRAISGFSELLLRDADPRLEAKSIAYLNRIYQNCLHMGTLIDDLLEFSRVQRDVLATRSIDMVELVWTSVHEQVEGHDVAAPEIEVRELPRCLGDWRLVKQVFTNLVSNAIKFSAASTPPRIVVDASTDEDRHEIVYSVSDNGVGFDMAYSDQLFQVFQRLHRAEDYAGTGVGLALCQRIVSRHGGRIWAEAEVDAGATFFVALPAEGVS